MKMSLSKFILLFLVCAFTFQFISNSLLGPEIRLFPVNGDFFPGTASPIGWKSTLAAIVYPVKIALLGPVSILFKDPDPDPAPPVFVIAFACYWTVIALVLYFIFHTIFTRINYRS